MSSVLIPLLLVALVAINVWFFKGALNPPRKQSARSILTQGIKNARELTTLRQHFQFVVSFGESKSLFGVSIPGTGEAAAGLSGQSQ